MASRLAYGLASVERDRLAQLRHARRARAMQRDQLADVEAQPQEDGETSGPLPLKVTDIVIMRCRISLPVTQAAVIAFALVTILVGQFVETRPRALRVGTRRHCPEEQTE